MNEVEPTLMERIVQIENLLELATQGDWRVVPDSRPSLHTYHSCDRKPGQEVYYGGYMGTGSLAEFAKYEASNADAELTVALHNAAPTLVAEIRRLQQEVSDSNERALRAEQRREAITESLRFVTPSHLHNDPAGMCLWVRDSINHVRATD